MFELKALISSGNKKLPRTMAIFNMGSATRCPSNALGLCPFGKSGKCYAFKAERMYPACRPYRERQSIYWHSTSAIEFAGSFLSLNEKKRKPFTHLRLNESGDFWSQDCVDKAEKIADYLGYFGIKVYTYSHRSDLDFSRCNHLVVNGSNFMVHNEFRAVEKISGNNPVCPMDCRKCSLCAKVHGKTVEVKIH